MEKKIVKDEELNNVSGGAFQPARTTNGRTYYRCAFCGSGQYINEGYDGEIPPKCPNCHEAMVEADARRK